MSWILNPEGTPTPRRATTGNEVPGGSTSDDDTRPKVKDPAIEGRMVSTKKANRPYLAYKEYRDKQQEAHDAWSKRKQVRDEKLARGENVGPEEADPTAEKEIGCLGLLKFILYLLVFILLAGKFFTGSFLWEYDGKWTRLRTYLLSQQRLFSEGLLSEFDGSTLEKPIYLAIDGDVYDVSSNPRIYGPGGSYHFMAGRDAARAFATGCFETHRTHDVRGLSESEEKSLNHWKNFFANHKNYYKIGRVVHAPIDTESPIPEPCRQKKDEPQSTESRTAGPAPPPDMKRDEL